jgi:hypothetical protein
MEDFLTLDDMYELYNHQGLTLDDVRQLLNTERVFTTDTEF